MLHRLRWTFHTLTLGSEMLQFVAVVHAIKSGHCMFYINRKLFPVTGSCWPGEYVVVRLL